MNEQDFIQRSRRVLLQSAQARDTATGKRLEGIRQQALTLAQTRQARYGWRPLGAIATMATLAIVIGIALRRPDDIPATVINDLDLLSVESETELELTEQLEFYLWLEQQLEQS